MDRQELIDMLEMLYPADSPDDDIAKLGQQFLEQAKREVSEWKTEPTEVSEWKTEPTEVLQRYYQLCMAREQRDTTRI